MTGQEAIAYIHAQHWQQRAPGLGRMRRLLRLLGNPQDKLRFVHVAGTNGKGSTCAMIAAILGAAGYRVGLNTSPYLVTFHERIRVDGRMISDEDLGRLTAQVRPAAESMDEPPTEFELITAIALLYFLQCSCDIVVLEVGLGGALDASNVIPPPEAAVITAMGMDHAAVLGATQTEIARAKAGIIKPGSPVISYGGCPEADAVIRETCRDQGTTLREADFARAKVRSLGLEGAVFDCAPYGTLTLPLAGAYQVQNALVAITAAETLAQRGWDIPPEAVRRGLRTVSWPGRFEVLRPSGPAVLLAGAHNPQGMAAAAKSLAPLFPGRKAVVLLGVLADKDVESMLDAVVPMAEAIVTVTPASPRAMGAEELRQRLLGRGVPVCACAGVTEGLRTAALAAGPDGVVCALGSLYLAAAVKQAAKTL